MDDLAAVAAAGDGWTHRLRRVRADPWEQPSACPGWSVRELVNHVNGGGHRYLLLMQGAMAEQLAPTRTQDHVGSQPVAAYLQWQEPLVDEFSASGALARTVHHPVGDRSGLELLRMRTLDLTLHAWDLARSVGLRAVGLYAAPHDTPGGTDAVRELLHRTGRGPGTAIGESGG